MRFERWAVSIVLAYVAILASVAVAETNATDSAASAEIRKVSDAGKYAFVLFHRAGDGAAGMRESVKKAVEDSDGRAAAIEVDVADPASGSTVRNYGLNRAPMPLVLAIAPNGGVTGGFPASCDPQVLAEAMVGPKAATCLKTLQDGKVVIICVQNSGSKNAETMLKTVAAFKEDQRISGFAESVVIDPADQAEKGFLGKLRVDPACEFATTLLVTPPGRIVGAYTNNVTMEVMFADLTRSMAGSTCGGGGCGPASSGCR